MLYSQRMPLSWSQMKVDAAPTKKGRVQAKETSSDEESSEEDKPTKNGKKTNDDGTIL